MTNEEAIEYMEIAKVDQKLYPEYIETIEFAIKALKKQIPIKPIIDGDYNPAECPCCGAELSEFVGDGLYKHWYSKKMCECGQMLDWS